MEYYLAMKMKGLGAHRAAWKSLLGLSTHTSLDVMLSQGRRPHNHACCVAPFIRRPDQASLVSGVGGQRLAGWRPIVGDGNVPCPVEDHGPTGVHG